MDQQSKNQEMNSLKKGSFRPLGLLLGLVPVPYLIEIGCYGDEVRGKGNSSNQKIGMDENFEVGVGVGCYLQPM